MGPHSHFFFLYSLGCCEQQQGTFFFCYIVQSPVTPPFSPFFFLIICRTHLVIFCHTTYTALHSFSSFNPKCTQIHFIICAECRVAGGAVTGPRRSSVNCAELSVMSEYVREKSDVAAGNY